MEHKGNQNLYKLIIVMDLSRTNMYVLYSNIGFVCFRCWNYLDMYSVYMYIYIYTSIQ